MYIPPKEDVDRVIDSLERVAPRTIAREAIQRHKAWKSDAARLKRPLSNQHGAGIAPVLDIDAVLNRTDVGRLVGKR